MEEDKVSSVVSRRTFIKVSGMSIAAVVASSKLMKSVAYGSPLPLRRRLVILEMNGGNDGLNTVIPFGDSAYYDARRQIAIPPDQVLPLDDKFGLNPSLTNMRDAYKAGSVGVIRGVGHSDPDLSHFRMMDLWRSGDPNGASSTGGTGWVGRLLEHLAIGDNPIAALSVSSGVSPMLIGPTDKAAAA